MTKDIDAFIRGHCLQLEAVKVPMRADGVGDWGKNASHWYCTITRLPAENTYPAVGTMAVLYSMGSAHKGKPALRDVLDSLRSDAQGLDQSFDCWARDFGYDTDSRKALDIYLTCQRQSDALRAMLGGHGPFLALLEDVEG